MKTVRFDYAGKAAFVTGAALGIGFAAAQAFAEAGASVVLADRKAEEVQAAAKKLTDAGHKAVAVTCDVTDESQIRAAVERTVSKFGRLDAAFNNAGIEQPVGPIDRVAIEDWDKLIAVNLRGVFLGMKYQIPLMLKNGGGAIVNTSSGAGVKGIKGQGAYAATKFGVIGLSKCAALDYADQNVRVNVVCPGIIETPMMHRFSGGTEEGRIKVIEQEPIGRMGKPEEIAATVLWLCSDAAAFVVGHAMVVDGGQTA